MAHYVLSRVVSNTFEYSDGTNIVENRTAIENTHKERHTIPNYSSP